MALSIPTITLNDGRAMPLLGLGTYKSTEKEAEKAIVTAAKYGYRLIDTASSYKNEDSIGRGIRASGIPRENFFITTKVWNTAQRVGDIEGAFNRSLDRLRLDYVDLYLIHWPVPGCYPETWRALEKIRESGRANRSASATSRSRTLPPSLNFPASSRPSTRSNAIRSGTGNRSSLSAVHMESPFKRMRRSQEVFI